MRYLAISEKIFEPFAASFPICRFPAISYGELVAIAA